MKSQPWILYSYIRQHLPGHSRAYFCLGENEKGRAFVARISLDLWRIYTLYGEKAFLSTLKPIPIMQLEYQLRRHATRIGNLWVLPLPTNWVCLREWALKKLNWDLVPRTRKHFKLLGRSGWFIELGKYTRPWHHGGSKIAVAGGKIFAPELHRCIHLGRPHLIGITPGWEYR